MINQGCSNRELDQAEVIGFLADPALYAGVERVDRFETHGNLVFLAGSEAWKIKRAVRFPYMDLSTLEKRRAACMREVEVNRQFAPDLYLGCVPIMRTPGGKLAFDSGGEIVEWTVHMRRFEQSALLSHLALEGKITGEAARLVADVVYESHEGAARAFSQSASGPIRRLVDTLSRSLATLHMFNGEDVAKFSRNARHQLDEAAATLDERGRCGYVRRCHGDLHLSNIVMWRGRPVLYDAIEFDEAIATIDTLYDLAFLLMDLDWHGYRRAANSVLNRYLWRSKQNDDLRGLVALPLFLALRAGIRAMVTAERAALVHDRGGQQDFDCARRYYRLVLGYVSPEPPRLIAVGGLSGTGKSTLSAALAPDVGGSSGAVLLRSDLERKAMAGVGELQRLPASAYTKEARNRIYAILQEKALLVLTAGHSVIVDAIYAGEDERRSVEAVAGNLGVPFRGLWLQADPEKLISRVTARRNDASDATSETVRTQLSSDPGTMSPQWTVIDASGTANETLRVASLALGLVTSTMQGKEPT